MELPVEGKGSGRVVGCLSSHVYGFEEQRKSLDCLEQASTHCEVDEEPVYADRDLRIGRDKKRW